MNKEDFLNEVWNSFSFDEIINAGLELRKCSSSDIINASKDYEDPNKEYDIEDVIDKCKLDDLCSELQKKYDLSDIINEFDLNDILDNIPDDEMLDHLKDTYTLDTYEDEIKEEYYFDMYNEIKSEWEWDSKQILKDILPDTGDDWREFLCDNFINCGYYDNEKFNEGFKNILNKISKSSYA